MKLKMYYKNSQDKLQASPALRGLCRKAVHAALTYEKIDFDCEVSLTFTDNEGIRELNREYRGIDRETDVLSFPMYDFAGGEEPEPPFPATLGDIVLSLEKAQAQADEYGHSFERETAFLCVHSTLHLLGYDHELTDDDDRDMRRRQDGIMEILKLSR